MLWRRRLRERALRLMLAAVALAAPRLTGAQVVELQAGGSSYFRGYGVNANLWGRGYDGWLGVGYQDAWRLGGFARGRAGRDTIRAGNDVMVLKFPTDIFGGGQNLLVQGATMQGSRGPVAATAFAGASATGLGVPLFAARRADRPFGALAVTDSVSANLRLHGVLLAATRLTAATSVEWRNQAREHLAATAGVGAGRAFGAVSGSVNRDFFSARMSWMRAAAGYRRVELPVPVQTRLDGLAAEFVGRPFEWLSLSASRQTFVRDSGLAADQARSTGTSFVASTQFGASHAAAGAYRTAQSSGTNRSAYVAAGTPIGSRFALDAYALATGLGDSLTRITPVLMLHERFSGQFSLDQVITLSGRQTSVSFGGSFVGALMEVGLGYQIVHVPFKTGDPFVKTLTLNLRLGIRGANARIATTVLPTGEVHYDANAASFLYLGSENGVQPTVVRSRFDQYVVSGVVQDEDGAAIGGAAIRVGEAVVFSDSRGHFFVRSNRRRAVSFAVLTDEFMVRGRYSVVNAPDRVTPEPDARAQPVVVVLRREP